MADLTKYEYEERFRRVFYAVVDVEDVAHAGFADAILTLHRSKFAADLAAAAGVRLRVFQVHVDGRAWNAGDEPPTPDPCADGAEEAWLYPSHALALIAEIVAPSPASDTMRPRDVWQSVRNACACNSPDGYDFSPLPVSGDVGYRMLNGGVCVIDGGEDVVVLTFNAHDRNEAAGCLRNLQRIVARHGYARALAVAQSGDQTTALLGFLRAKLAVVEAAPRFTSGGGSPDFQAAERVGRIGVLVELIAELAGAGSAVGSPA
jgi:hypothetical protein